MENKETITHVKMDKKSTVLIDGDLTLNSSNQNIERKSYIQCNNMIQVKTYPYNTTITDWQDDTTDKECG